MIQYLEFDFIFNSAGTLHQLLALSQNYQFPHYISFIFNSTALMTRTRLLWGPIFEWRNHLILGYCRHSGCMAVSILCCTGMISILLACII